MRNWKSLLILGIVLLLAAICLIIYFFAGSNENTKWDMKPMIMVNDTIYTDTGQVIEEEIDESSIVGKITSAVDGTKKPTKNGESNFGCEGAPYTFYKDGIVVKLDNNWIYFEKEKNN